MSSTELRLALPKGRMQDAVFQLLRDAGIELRFDRRGYRPVLSLPNLSAKILKPQNIVEMLHVGSRDVGFAGHDWVVEKGADLIEALDLGFDPVRIVAAGGRDFLHDGEPPARPFSIATEYAEITARWVKKRGYDATIVRTYGATEVFPPEDADCIVDNTATGATLKANGLEIFAEILRSSTRLYASRKAMDDPAKRDRIETLAMLLRSVIEARSRVMIEINVAAADLNALAGVLPALKKPTIAPLQGDDGFAVKIAASRAELPALIPAIRQAGGRDVLVMNLAQIVR